MNGAPGGRCICLAHSMILCVWGGVFALAGRGRTGWWRGRQSLEMGSQECGPLKGEPGSSLPKTLPLGDRRWKSYNFWSLFFWLVFFFGRTMWLVGSSSLDCQGSPCSHFVQISALPPTICDFKRVWINLGVSWSEKLGAPRQLQSVLSIQTVSTGLNAHTEALGPKRTRCAQIWANSSECVLSDSPLGIDEVKN